MRAAPALALVVAGALAAASSPSWQAAAHDEPAAGDTQEPRMITALRANGARVLALGERGGLSGHFVEVAQGDAYGLYLTPDGYAVAGLLYAPDGTLLTGRQIAAAGGLGADREPEAARHATDEYPRDRSAASRGSLSGTTRLAHAYEESPGIGNAEAPFDRSRDAFGFTLGRRGPLVTMFADPACRWSRSAVSRLGHAALDGRMRLRVVPVGVLGAASAREAAAIASAPDPALAWFEGAAGAARPEGGRRIERNNALFDAWGAGAVPLIAWQARDGRIVHRLGDVDDIPAWLEGLPP